MSEWQLENPRKNLGKSVDSADTILRMEGRRQPTPTKGRTMDATTNVDFWHACGHIAKCETLDDAAPHIDALIDMGVQVSTFENITVPVLGTTFVHVCNTGRKFDYMPFDVRIVAHVESVNEDTLEVTGDATIKILRAEKWDNVVGPTERIDECKRKLPLW